MTITGNFEPFQCFQFETNFLKNENLFQQTGGPFLVESAKIESATFPYKSVQSEDNVKTFRMRSTNWRYHKEQRFASNYFNFLKILLHCKNLL